MNLRKQVEPLLSAALKASSVQRHAHRTTPRLALMERWLRRASENHHGQSRSLRDLNVGAGSGQGSVSSPAGLNRLLFQLFARVPDRRSARA